MSPAERVRRALAGDPRLGEAAALSIADDGGGVVLTGEVADIAAKRRIAARAAAVPDLADVVDRLRVRPERPRPDADIREDLRDAFLEDPAFAGLALCESVGGAAAVVSLRRLEAPAGTLDFDVADGVVTLDGEVESPLLARLAGVAAWWVPGVRDVVERVAAPPAADEDGLAEVVRRVLARDPFLDARGVFVDARGGAVALAGRVPSERERALAEYDAWCVLGVADVDNRLRVEPKRQGPL